MRGLSAIKQKRLLNVSTPIILVLAIFFPALNSNMRLARRDECFYYYPLFELVQSLLETKTAPWWNPYDNLGQPLAGDPTSSVFYPGKAIFILSSLGIVSFNSCFKAYVLAHLLLAYYFSYYASRKIGSSRTGASIAGLAYAFSGQILFQYSNVIYLVGAAWAPLLFVNAFLFGQCDKFKKRLKYAVQFGVVASLTILGGEPQIVYLALLLAGTVFLIAPIKSRSACSIEKEDVKSRLKKRLTRSFSFIVIASATSFALASVQILPSLEFISNTSRGKTVYPRSIWEIPGACFGASSQRETKTDDEFGYFDYLLCADFSKEDYNYSRTTYRFSVGPWRWLEFLFPNIGGKQFPQNERWFEAAPEEIAVWSPTLYFGIIPFLLAISTIRLRVGHSCSPSGRARTLGQAAKTCRLLVVFGILGSLGGFGFVHFMRTLVLLFNGESIPKTFTDGDPIGGLYWFLNVFIPMFSDFRYPGKLMTIASFGFAILAGIGWDCVRDDRRFTSILRVVFVIGLFGLVSSTILYAVRDDVLRGLHIQANPLNGPFCPRASLLGIARSFLHATAILLFASVAIAVRRRVKRNTSNVRNVAGRLAALDCVLILIISLDVYFASSWVVSYAPVSLFDRKSSLFVDKADSSAFSHSATPPTRIYRFPVWFPPLFQEKSSPRRTEERVIWDVETLFPKYSIARNAAIIDSRGAATEYYYSKYIDEAINRQGIQAELAFLGVSKAIGPEFWLDRIIDGNSQSFSRNAVQDWNWTTACKEINQRTSRAAIIRDERRVDVENPRFLGSNSTVDVGFKYDEDYVDIIEYSPNRIVYLIVAQKDSEAVFAEQFWKNWRARLIPLALNDFSQALDAKFDPARIAELTSKKARNAREISVERYRGFMRRIKVPQGAYCAIFEYRPVLVFLGGAISLVSWIVLLLTRLGRKRFWHDKQRNR